MADFTLHQTRTSPYARMVRIVIAEKGLQDRVRVVEAKTRTEGSPYYAVNPSGRVPFLERPEGPGLEDSSLIIEYLDGLDGTPAFETDFDVRRLESVARSMLDGLAVWARESRRPSGEQSPTILRHEEARAARLVDVWESEIEHPVMSGEFNLAQLTLFVALKLEGRFGFEWRQGHPKLAAWVDRLAERPSVRSEP